MNKVILYTDKVTKNTCIVRPCLGAKKENETDIQFLERIKEKDVPKDATNVYIEDASKLPTDRYFRNAWEIKSRKVEINMPKAKVIKLGKLRAERTKLMAGLDVEYMMSDEIADEKAKADIVSKKQKLRDFPKEPEFLNIDDPEELKNYKPSIFKELEKEFDVDKKEIK